MTVNSETSHAREKTFLTLYRKLAEKTVTDCHHAKARFYDPLALGLSRVPGRQVPYTFSQIYPGKFKTGQVNCPAVIKK